MRVAVIGSQGFVGSAIVRYLSQLAANVEVIPVTRATYQQFMGTTSDIVIEAACNSRKYLAEENPLEEFSQSVTHRLQTLRDFPASWHVHISSVDVYSDLTSPGTTGETVPIDLSKISNYGFHKLLAEQLVQHYARNWLILRLAGMVGSGLRKNPVYDILHDLPLRIHPDSQYQFMQTDEVAAAIWKLIQIDTRNEIFNIGGSGLISPYEIAQLAGRRLDMSLLTSEQSPRIVDVSTEKISRIMTMPTTLETIKRFVQR